MRDPTTRFHRRRLGRQGNRRQQLSSAVAVGTTGGWEGRPLPHFPAETGATHSHTTGCGQGSPTSNTSPVPGEPGGHRGSGVWPCPQGQNNRHRPPRQSSRLDSSHSGEDDTAFFRTLNPLPNPAPAIVRDPGILLPRSSIFPDTPHPPPSEADTLTSEQRTHNSQRIVLSTTPPGPQAFSECQEKSEGCGQQQELATGTGCSSPNWTDITAGVGPGIGGGSAGCAEGLKGVLVLGKTGDS